MPADRKFWPARALLPSLKKRRVGDKFKKTGIPEFLNPEEQNPVSNKVPWSFCLDTERTQEIKACLKLS